MYDILIYFTLFLIISFIGWVTEIVYTGIDQKVFTDRGFLLGPYCPIYGSASLLMMLFLHKYVNDPVVLFVMAANICSVMEYITSYIMEKLFKARWWDYSQLPFNVNGRICLSNSILFGIGAVFLLKYIQPFLLENLYHFPKEYFFYIAYPLLIIFILDVILSGNIIVRFKHTVENIQKDYTGEISDKVRKVIMNKSYPFRRLFMAFPNQIIVGLKKTIWEKIFPKKKKH
ncbi:MAG: hypothetical protein PHN72_04025 [Bacilli bacterium]|nr:hypothetical protein [Bacilli bacterium]